MHRPTGTKSRTTGPHYATDPMRARPALPRRENAGSSLDQMASTSTSHPPAPAPPASPAGTSPAGSQIFAGHYRLDRVVADASATVVWKAIDQRTGEPVAVKFFPPALIRTTMDLVRVRDVIAPVRLIQHPHLVAAREVVTSGELAAIVTPWVDGASLAALRLARRGGFFDVADIEKWVHELLDVMEAAHTQGIVHGALNPHVVLVRPEGNVAVFGCGINAWLRIGLRQIFGKSAGHEDTAWLSPARLRGEAPRLSDDLFAFGAIVYELITGSLPGGAAAWWSGPRPPPAMAVRRKKAGIVGAPVPSAWELVVHACLEPEEARRLRSFREVRVRLGQGVAPASVETGPGTAGATDPAAAPADTSPILGDTTGRSPEMVASSPPEATFAAAPAADLPSPPAAEESVPPPWTEMGVAAGPDEGTSTVPLYAQSSSVRPPSRGRRRAGRGSPLGAAGSNAVKREPPSRWASRFLRALLTVTILGTLAVGGGLSWHVFQEWNAYTALLGDITSFPANANAGQQAAMTERIAVAGSRFNAERQATIRRAWTQRQSALRMASTPPAPQPGVIVVQSDPPGAMVRVGDRPAQPAPFEIKDVPAGEHPVAATLDGYAQYAGTIAVAPGHVATAHVSLQRLTGRLRLDSGHESVMYELRNENEPAPTLRGFTPAELEVPAGQYRLIFHGGVGPAREEMIEVVTGETAVARTQPPVTRLALPPPETPASEPAVAPALSPREVVAQLSTDALSIILDTPEVMPDLTLADLPPLPVPVAPAANETAVAAFTDPATAPITALYPEAAPADTGRFEPAPAPDVSEVPLQPEAAFPREDDGTRVASAIHAAPNVTARGPDDRARPPPFSPEPVRGTPRDEMEPSTTLPPEEPVRYDAIYQLSEVNVAPQLLERAAPMLPRSLLSSTREQRIELLLVVDRFGRVSSASVRKTTHDGLIEPCLSAVRLWRFSPARKDGQAVAVRFLAPLVFREE